MGPTVLVVDDEQAICDNLSAYLEDEGMQVQVAHSGEDAVALVAGGQRFQACVMDLRLPGMSGTEAILALGRLDPAMCFLIHTGSANDAVTTALLRSGLGRVPVFRKPISDMGELARALRACTEAG